MFRDYIVVWKSQQQAVLNGARVDNPMSLDTIQVWFEELATQALTIMQQIRQLNNANEHLGTFGTDLLPVYRLDCGGKVKEVLSLIANNCFIVNNQPPQVMKKGTKFPKPLSTTLILGDKFKVSFKDSTVYTTIINERQAKRVASCTDSTDTWELSSDGRSGELKNEKKAFYFDEKVKRYIADFKFDTQLNAIKRADKRNAMTECVMEEKFCLCFRSTVVIGDIDVRVSKLHLMILLEWIGVSGGRERPLIPDKNSCICMFILHSSTRYPFQLWSQVMEARKPKLWPRSCGTTVLVELNECPLMSRMLFHGTKLPKPFPIDFYL